MLMKYFSGKILQENIPSINKKRCINLRSKAQKCSSCKDICPVAAININSTSINIKEELCTQCGICRAVCPSQAIELKRNDEIKAVMGLDEKEIVVVGCNKEGNEGNITFSCLHGLHKEYLAGLLLALKDKKIYFNLCQCENCHVINKNNYFKASLNSAITFINNFNIDPHIELISCKENIPKYNDKTISRRDLFTFFKKQSTKMVSDIVEDTIGKENNYIPRDFILKYIDEFISTSDKNVDISENESFFTNWNVKDNCSGCGACQAACPSNAWKIKKENNMIRISHNSRKCTSCGFCADLCYRKALVKDTFYTDLLKGPVVKKEIYLNSCKKCKKEYIPNEKDTGFCHICEKRSLVSKSILQVQN